MCMSWYNSCASFQLECCQIFLGEVKLHKEFPGIISCDITVCECVNVG